MSVAPRSVVFRLLAFCRTSLGLAAHSFRAMWSLHITFSFILVLLFHPRGSAAVLLFAVRPRLALMCSALQLCCASRRRVSPLALLCIVACCVAILSCLHACVCCLFSLMAVCARRSVEVGCFGCASYGRVTSVGFYCTFRAVVLV